MSVFTQYFRR